MAIRIKREGRKTYVETDTIDDWIEALYLDLPIKAPPAFAKLFGPLPDNHEDFETPEEVMAWVDKRREEIAAAEKRREEMVVEERRRRWLARKRTRLYAHGPRRQRANRRASS